MEQTLIPVILGLVEVIKRAGIPARFLPVVGIVLGGLAYYFIPGLNGSILDGIVAGLAASGLWSGTRAVVGK